MKNALLVLVLALLSPTAVAAVAAGEVTLQTGGGSALAADGGAVRPLAKGSAVMSGETLVTGPNSYLGVKFSDGGSIVLRPNTRFLIESYRYPPAEAPAARPAPAAAPATRSPAPGAPPPAAPSETPTTGQSAAFRLLRGGFRAISGLIGRVRKQDYRVSTTIATIGIRGTDYWVYLCDSACAADPTVAASAGVAGDPRGGLLLGVVHGGIFTADESGAVLSELSAGNYQMVMPGGAVVNLPIEPRFVKVDPIPDPAACP